MYILLCVHAPKRPFFRIPIPYTSRCKIVQIMLSHSLLASAAGSDTMSQPFVRRKLPSLSSSRTALMCGVVCVCVCALARRSVPWGRDVGGSPVYWIRTAQFLHVFRVCFWWDLSLCQPLCAPHTGCCCCVIVVGCTNTLPWTMHSTLPAAVTRGAHVGVPLNALPNSLLLTGCLLPTLS
jgi:hypothetical protein